MRAERPALLLALALALSLAVLAPAQAACTANNPNAAVPEDTPAADFTDNADGTVTHARSGLSWKRCAQGQAWNGSTCTGAASSFTWQAALAQAAAENFAGRTDWRLPNVKELQSIAEPCGYNPAINQAVFPATPSSYFWSASTYVPNPASAWLVVFYGGDAGADNKTNAYAVRLVRGGQSFDSYDLLAPDTTPNAFSFTPQTGAAPSSVATSNPIAVAGINAAATISVGGGSYAINGGGYTGAPGTVNNGDTVTVQLTASASYGATTTATLDIGGVSGVFSVTTAGAGLPAAPAIGAATPGNGQLSVAFTPGALNGGTLVAHQLVCTGPSSYYLSRSGAASPIVADGMINGSVYTCWVRTQTNAGYSAWSAPVSGTPGGGAGLPGAPVMGTATAGAAQVSVSFTPGSLNGGTLQYHQVACTPPAGTPAYFGYGTASPVVVGGLTSGMAYLCWARTVSNLGAGSWSGVSNGFIPGNGPPGKPAMGVATAGAGSISVAFTAGSLNGGTLQYHQAVCAPAAGTPVYSGTATGSPVVVSGMAGGVAQQCWVRTVSDLGAGAWSDPSGWATPAAPDAPLAGRSGARQR